MSTLYSDGQHTNMLLGEPTSGTLSESHRYLILDHGKAFILEHGLQQYLTQAFQEISTTICPTDLEYVFLSLPLFHLDIALNRWLYASDAKALCAESWVTYLNDVDLQPQLRKRLFTIPDQGLEIALGQSRLQLIPAHFLFHSVAFCLYDPLAKVLYTGELASTTEATQLILDRFEDLRPLIEPFHKRFAASSAAVASWVKQIRKLDVQVVAPRRGSILKGKAEVDQLWNWLETTPCGKDLNEIKCEQVVAK